jgi:glycerophosphoryl diester phosphodiesterase
MIIAHRGGAGDFPENTILAITSAVQAGVDGLWLTVQASSDQVAMLYRPTDLSSLTNGAGAVNSKTALELQQLNAGFNFAGVDGYPYRENPIGIPTLEQAVSVVPADMPLFLDLKQQPAEPVVSAVVDVLRRTGSTARSVVYSTDAGITDLAVRQADLNVAESRDLTRERLLNMALVHRCEPAPSRGIWAGFELHREVTVTEAFTLGLRGRCRTVGPGFGRVFHLPTRQPCHGLCGQHLRRLPLRREDRTRCRSGGFTAGCAAMATGMMNRPPLGQPAAGACPNCIDSRFQYPRKLVIRPSSLTR